MRRSAVLLLTCLAIARTTDAEDVPRGEIVDPVATLHDGGETFALYLPTAYTTERRWPIVFVLDPRSRGRMAAELFRDGAERFGYILVSSNSTRSDSLPEEDPNARAMVALLRDAMSRFAADEHRVYLAGFSGTARYAWSVGFGLQDRIAGVIGCGGALPGPLEQWSNVTFDFFGAAGETDFNHREMRRLDEELDATSITHRFAFFPGGHQWAPPAVMTEALAWMEVRAMKRGTRPASAALVGELYANGSADAGRLETDADLYAAFRRWDQLAKDFDGLRDVSTARQSAERLGRLPRVVDAGAEIRSAVDREIAYSQRLDAVLNQLITRWPLPPLQELVSRLQIPQLQKQATGESITARSAQRQLESAFVRAAFYAPRRLERAGETERAILSLRLAAEIKPRHWRAWYALAAAYAGTGRKSKAVTALERAIDAGYAHLSRIETDPDLDAIRNHKGYQRLIERLRR